MDGLADGPVAAVAWRGEAAGAQGAALALVMDEFAHGVLVATPAGNLLHANQAARNELARRRALAASAGKLQACSPAGAKSLLEALQRAGEGKRSLIELPAAGAAPLAVVLVPLKPEDGSPRVALLFSRSMVCDPLMLCFFARRHGLTATEEQVLAILCQGHSTPQVADQMKIAVSTVRSHVRSMCAKTRAGGVRELVGRVALLPPVAPPLRLDAMH